MCAVAGRRSRFRRKVPESSGRFRKVPVRAGVGSGGRFRKVPEDFGGFQRQVPEGSGTFLERSGA